MHGEFSLTALAKEKTSGFKKCMYFCVNRKVMNEKDKITQTVAIEQARFFSPIGYYEEERILGNEFFVDVHVAVKVDFNGSDELEDTLNYEELYAAISKVMRQERKLLESAAQEILEGLQMRFAHLEGVVVKITKMHPPFGADASRASVKLKVGEISII